MGNFLLYISSFIIILSIIVFIHEFGHYYFAKKFGVKIEAFAIGFGKKIFGWTDKSGTEWKFCLFPLGGYVKMFGDQDPSSAPGKNLVNMSDKDKNKSFFYKPLYQKFLIVFAGPLANYILGIVITFILLIKFGTYSSSNIVTDVEENMPAYEAGIRNGDTIIAVEGRKIKNFSDLQQVVQLSPNIEIIISILRDGKNIDYKVTPDPKITSDILGNSITTGFIGVRSDDIIFKNVSIINAIPMSFIEVWDITTLTAKALGQIITGERSLSDLSGPIKIAKYSGQVTKKSLTEDENGNRNIYLLLWFIAMISINLGFVNLLPIPMLDGGHLFMYLIESIKGNPISVKSQEYIYRIGFLFLITIFILVTLNDIKYLFK